MDLDQGLARERSAADNAWTILWIDDDGVAVKHASESLRVHGIRVDSAANALTGILRAREYDYALVLLELRLPDMSGIETFHALRSLKIETPIVFVSRFSNVRDVVTVTRLGARDVLEKPLDGEDLVAALREYLPLDGVLQQRRGEDPTSSASICQQIARATQTQPQIALAQAAALVGVDRHVVERAVRQETGCTYRRWRQALAIRRAAVLLRCSRLPVKIIAYDLGYTSVQAFARAFRSVVGSSPLQYRRGDEA
jgi:two-component system, response regulator YesN